MTVEPKISRIVTSVFALVLFPLSLFLLYRSIIYLLQLRWSLPFTSGE